jgi:type III polyketide synthase
VHGTDGNTGWKVILTPRVPKLTAGSIGPAFNDLKTSLPQLPPDYQNAADFDWAMHPGGATILSGAERVMDITPEHMRASYDTYINHGNSSSATIFSVMNRLRSKEMDAMAPDGRVRDYVVGCAFGPGITVEMCMLKRNMAHGTEVTGLQTPPDTPAETETEPSEAGDGEWGTETSGSSAEENSLSQSQDQYAMFVTESLEHLDLD